MKLIKTLMLFSVLCFNVNHLRADELANKTKTNYDTIQMIRNDDLGVYKTSTSSKNKTKVKKVKLNGFMYV